MPFGSGEVSRQEGKQPSVTLLVLAAALSSLYLAGASSQQPTALPSSPAPVILTPTSPHADDPVNEKTKERAVIITSTPEVETETAPVVKEGLDRERPSGEDARGKGEVKTEEGERRKVEIKSGESGRRKVTGIQKIEDRRQRKSGKLDAENTKDRPASVGMPEGGQGEGEPTGKDKESPIMDLKLVLPRANLDNYTVTDIFFNDGEVALLPCKFPQLSTLHQKAFLMMQVSWIRRSDWHILTTGVFTYTSDARFSVLHQESSDDWTLQIKYAKMRDNGTYECQMYTGTGVLSQFINLHVSTPRAAILGPRKLHVQEGDTITLICVIYQGRPPFVFWYHGQQMVNYDTRLSVETHVEGARTHSRLTITHAKRWDSGNYSCIPPNVEPSYVIVYVSQGDTVAAVQRPPSSSAPSSSLPLNFSWAFFASVVADALLCGLLTRSLPVR